MMSENRGRWSFWWTLGIALLGMLLVVLTVMLLEASVAATKQASQQAQFVLTTESEAADLVFTQREVDNLIITANEYLAGISTRRDIQIARALLERRLTVTSDQGPNPANSDVELRAALSEFDAEVPQLPSGTLPADARDQWAALIEPPLVALDSRGKQLFTDYERTASQRSQELAQSRAKEQLELTLLTIATVLTALALIATIATLLVRSQRRGRRRLGAEEARLNVARTELGRTALVLEEQARVLDSIATGSEVRSIVPIVARLAALTGPDGVGQVRCGAIVLAVFPEGAEPSSDVVPRWSRQLDGLCGEAPAEAGILEVFADEPLSEQGVEEAEACADLLRIAIERDRNSAALVQQARHDSLTGLPNRATLMDELESAVVERRRRGARDGENGRLSLLFVDLDRFKDVNDTLGHEAGDRLLIGVVGRLQAAVRQNDRVYRLAGDEFVVLCPDMPDDAAAEQLAQRLLVSLAEPFTISNTPVWVEASIGISQLRAGSSPDELLREADLAMYRAKQDGRGRWHAFDDELATAAHSRLHLSKALRLAVEQEELRLLYQPVVDMVDGTILGFEALIRWDRPQHGLMGPEHFLEMAEETRDILGIGRWVVAEAARTLAQWRAAGLRDDISMAVNVTAQQLRDPMFIHDIIATIAREGVPARCLALELTEHSLIDVRLVAESLSRARAAGILLALDDFGTGYSSLTQLEGLPVDVVKVDRQFVVRLADGGTRHEVFLGALVELVSALDLQLIVEGVETEAERDALISAGFRVGQGYLFGRPAPPQDALHLALADERVGGVGTHLRLDQ
ncbi:MAG: hypothetical protein RLZ55_1258 [Actinomycetota bacterium]